MPEKSQIEQCVSNVSNDSMPKKTQIEQSSVSNVSDHTFLTPVSKSSCSGSGPQNKRQKVSWDFSDEDFEIEENEDEMAKHLELLSSRVTNNNNSSSETPSQPTNVRRIDIDVTVSYNNSKVATFIIGNAYILRDFLKGIETFKNM